MTSRNARQWADAVEDFAEAMTREGFASSTMDQRVKHVRRLAADAVLGPWEMGRADVTAWLGTAGPTEATRRAHRTSLRGFYRWAFKTGRVFEDPTEAPDQRAQQKPIPEDWIKPLKAYRGHLRAAGRPETTVAVRIAHMRRIAREHRSLGPFELDLDDLIEWLAGKRWANETRRSMRATLRSFYGWAAETGRIDEDPARLLPVVKSTQPRPRPATDEAYQAALSAAGPRESLMLRLSAELGLRRSEVAGIHTSDLTAHAGHWLLTVTGKGNKERTLPLPDGLAARLREMPDGYVFPGDCHGHLSAAYIGKRVSRLLPEGVTMHALRHRFATRAYDIDRDVFTVQKLLGHASPETTQRYVQVTDLTARRLVEAAAGPWQETA